MAIDLTAAGMFSSSSDGTSTIGLFLIGLLVVSGTVLSIPYQRKMLRNDFEMNREGALLILAWGTTILFILYFPRMWRDVVGYLGPYF